MSESGVVKARKSSAVRQASERQQSWAMRGNSAIARWNDTPKVALRENSSEISNDRALTNRKKSAGRATRR